MTFWSQSLFNTGGYFKNLTQIRLDINQKEYLSPELFRIWLNYFDVSLTYKFAGFNAGKTKKQALSFATEMQIKFTTNGRVDTT